MKVVQQKLILGQRQIKTGKKFEFGAMDGRFLKRAIVITALSPQPASTLELAGCREKGATVSMVTKFD